jgi:hypothetical protein
MGSSVSFDKKLSRYRRRLQPSIGSLSFKSGMSILIDNARSAVFRDGEIIISMVSGSEIRFPVARNPRLAKGTAEQVSRIEISPYGVHWPDLDEDLSFRGLLAGDYGQHQKVEPSSPPNGFCHEFGRSRNAAIVRSPLLVGSRVPQPAWLCFPRREPRTNFSVMAGGGEWRIDKEPRRQTGQEQSMKARERLCNSKRCRSRWR